jgi:hypothetical protein
MTPILLQTYSRHLYKTLHFEFLQHIFTSSRNTKEQELHEQGYNLAIDRLDDFLKTTNSS